MGNKSRFTILIACCFFIIVGWFFLQNKVLDKAVIRINNTELDVEIADTALKRKKGLSGRESILDNSGMLFIFNKSGLHAFWMINMKFPIDIIWIDEDLKVVGVEENIPPKSFPKIFRPNQPSQYVVEMNAGWVDKHNIKQGDIFSFEN